MKKQILLTLLMVFSVIPLSLFGQEPPMASMKVPYRQLIISEFLNNTMGYIEVTNVGDSTINMQDFLIWGSHQRSVSLGSENVIRDTLGIITDVRFDATNPSGWYIRGEDQLLKPGKSYVVMNVWDGTYSDGSLRQRERLFEVSDYYIHRQESTNDTTIAATYYPEYENYAFDSIDYGGSDNPDVRGGKSMMDIGAGGRILIFQNLMNKTGSPGDSALIDMWNTLQSNGGGSWDAINVAGIEDASANYGFARKATVTQGNLNWDLSAGVSRGDSEWLLLPRLANSQRDVWTSIGVHDDFQVDVSSDQGISFNDAAGTMSVPWGIYKGDSIIHEMTLGPGMLWIFSENGSDIESQGHLMVQDGDTLGLYATGNVLDSAIYTISVQAPAASEARVFEKRMPFPDPEFDEVTGLRLDPYYLTNPPFPVVRMNGTAIDSVTQIPYGTRVDTVFKYLEKAPLANWEIIWVDGEERPDVKDGDILRVTAENGSDTHDYYLSVLPFTPSNNALLSAITWPDKPGFLLNWKQDTIPFFDPRVVAYTVYIPYQVEGVPALQAIPEDLNASVVMTPAAKLEGTDEETTTIIEVTAESDTSFFTYKVTFRREKPRPLQQKWEAEPIFSEVAGRIPGGNGTLEIYNPGTEPIDLSQYFISSGKLDLENIFTTMFTGSRYNYKYLIGYIPGMVIPPDSIWQLNPGVMVFDPAVDPILEPGETFVIVNDVGTGPAHPVYERVDVTFITAYSNATEWENAGGNQWGDYTATSGWMDITRAWDKDRKHVIWKILNDSITRSLKPVRDIEDFELVDLFGWEEEERRMIIGGREVPTDNAHVMLKPDVYLPNTEIKGGFGNTPDSSNWILEVSGDIINGITYTSGMMWYNFGVHYTDPVTFFSSVVYSDRYQVDEGYTGNLFIRGVSNGENVTAFLGNIIKGDEDQALEVKTAVDGAVKNGADPMLDTDVLVVTSADGENSTTYKISLAALNDNNTLTLASGSALTLERDGDAGTVSGFDPGTSIVDVLAGVKKPDLASLKVMNTAGELVPLKYMNMDTVYVNTMATGDIVFKVTAQNGDVAQYSLMPVSSASDAFVLSSVYIVTEATSIISAIPGGTAVSGLLANLMPAPGATVEILDKLGNPRTLGTLAFDDYLKVTSEDGTVSRAYALNFVGEGAEGEVITLPPDPASLVLDSISGSGVVSLSWDHESGLEDGFIIMRDGAVIDTVETHTFSETVTLGNTYIYSVHAYNVLGNTNSVTLSVLARPTSINMRNAEISIYPSITQDWVYFKNLPAESQVVVVDLTGRTVLVRNSADLNNGLSLEPYEKGYYLIKVMRNQENLKMVKVIKQ